jgi:hypothetical protein
VPLKHLLDDVRSCKPENGDRYLKVAIYTQFLRNISCKHKMEKY